MGNIRQTLVSNSNSYKYFKTDTLQDLLNREDLLDLPMQDWNNLFIEKDGKSFADNMYQVLKSKIIKYDKSENVNSFMFNGEKFWIHKKQRQDLHTLIGCNPTIVPILLSENKIVELPLNKAKKLLADLEIYSSKCFINTQKHLNDIKNLKSVEDMIKYNYTKGYPIKLIFNE